MFRDVGRIHMPDQGGRLRPRRILTVFAPKGGVGKSTLATNLLMAARLDGLDAVGLDLDAQGSFVTWGQDRARYGRQPEARVIAARVVDWRDALARERARALAIVDTPPGIDDEERLASILEVARTSSLVLIPTLAHGATLRKLVDFGTALRDRIAVDTLFVLNMTITGRSILVDARGLLQRRGGLAPVEIPQRDHIMRAIDVGMAVVEDPRLAGAEQMLALWRFAAARLGLRAEAA
jgi:chromosome partitioning protein